MTCTPDDPTAIALGDWIHHQADKGPDRTAISFGDHVLSYRAFADRIGQLTSGLRQKAGLKHGDRIAYLGHSHPDLLTLVFAAARLGLIVVPLNWRLARPEHQAILADADPALLLVDARFTGEAEAMSAEPGSWRPIGLGFQRSGWLSVDDLLMDDGNTAMAGMASDPLLLVYTSGTTGAAKGAVLTQDAVRWNAANSVDMHDLTCEDRILTSLPLFHVGGLNIQTLPALAVGAEVFLEARFDPSTTFETIVRARPTQTVLVPAMMKALIDHPDFEDTDLSSLRQITTGSSIVPVELIQAFHDRGIPVTQVYGTTETAPIAVYQRRADAFRTIGSSGEVAKHGEMRLADDAGRAVDAGQPGEIQIRGPQVMTGYWNNPAATEEAFAGDWFRTGDVGRMDQDSRLWVEARKDDLIKSGSERIYPAEIEDILRAVDGVADVAVIARTDPTWGEVPVAVVQPAAGCEPDADKLLQGLDGRIARFKRPKEVIFVDSLPRSALGKVLRYRLRAALDRRD
ncbi:MAG: class I adenylate-forming enzyme family protein [Geminicoccaceae bacterium]